MQRKHTWAAACAVVIVTGVAGIAGVATLRTEEAPPVAFEEAPLRVRIDVSERRLYVEQDSEVVASYGVAVGTSSHPTPRGSYSMRRIIWNPRWVPPDAAWARNERPRAPGDPRNPMGRVKVFFREPDYYIHGTNAESSIGTAASHGCVRMRNEDVIEFARTLIDHGGAPIEPGLIRRLINNVRQTKELRLRNAVPLRVQS